MDTQNKKKLKKRSKSLIIITTYFKSDMSLSKKFIILDVNIKLENTVNKPAMPVIERENCVNISYLTRFLVPIYK